jgi:hypothetical protein
MYITIKELEKKIKYYYDNPMHITIENNDGSGKFVVRKLKPQKMRIVKF